MRLRLSRSTSIEVNFVRDGASLTFVSGMEDVMITGLEFDGTLRITRRHSGVARGVDPQPGSEK